MINEYTVAIIVSILALFGSVSTAGFSYFGAKKKNQADYAKTITDASEKVIDILDERLEKMERQIRELEARRDELEAEIAEHKQTAVLHEARIKQLEAVEGALKADITRREQVSMIHEQRIEELELAHNKLVGGVNMLVDQVIELGEVPRFTLEDNNDNTGASFFE